MSGRPVSASNSFRGSRVEASRAGMNPYTGATTCRPSLTNKVPFLQAWLYHRRGRLSRLGDARGMAGRIRFAGRAHLQAPRSAQMRPAHRLSGWLLHLLGPDAIRLAHRLRQGDAKRATGCLGRKKLAARVRRSQQAEGCILLPDPR